MMHSGERVTFLIVDDDDVAVMGMKRAISKIGLTNPTEVARDGEEALSIIRDRQNDLKPYIVTLDLNMPRMGGLQFLEEVRRDPALQDSVIFVVTTSDAPADITQAYAKNIAGYVVKDNAYETLKQAIDMLKSYVSVIRLPTESLAPHAELRLV